MAGRKTINISITIPHGLLRWVDTIRGDVSRSKYLCKMIRRRKLKGEENGLQEIIKHNKATGDNVAISK